jgi:flagellar hook-associated protein 3 FlgL
MRISASSFPNVLVRQLGDLSVRQNRLQNQVATGQRIQNPEDDPDAMRRVMDLQAESKGVAQYLRNTTLQLGQTKATFNAINGLKTVANRATEIANGADGTRSQAELLALAQEVEQLLQQAVDTANTKYEGRYLLAGTQSDQPAFVATKDGSGNISGVAYQGNTDVASVEISPGTTVPGQLVGANTSGTGVAGLVTDSRSGADLFAHLIELKRNLEAGNTTAINSQTRGKLSQDSDHVITQLSANGAVQARLEANSAMMTDRQNSIEKLVSNEADADLAQTIVRLSETQNAYQAALQSGAKILNSSLLDYLR